MKGIQVLVQVRRTGPEAQGTKSQTRIDTETVVEGMWYMGYQIGE